jgi:hypothetical protein
MPLRTHAQSTNAINADTDTTSIELNTLLWWAVSTLAYYPLALLTIDFLHHHNLCLCSIHFRLHLQICSLLDWCISSVYKYLRPPRSAFRHRSRQRNVRIRPGFLGLPSSKNVTRGVLQWNRGCCTLGSRSYWSCSLGIHLGDGQSRGFRDPSPFWQLAQAGRGRKQTQRNDGWSHVGNCDFNRYRKVFPFYDKLIVEC